MSASCRAAARGSSSSGQWMSSSSARPSGTTQVRTKLACRTLQHTLLCRALLRCLSSCVFRVMCTPRCGSFFVQINCGRGRSPAYYSVLIVPAYAFAALIAFCRSHQQYPAAEWHANQCRQGWNCVPVACSNTQQPYCGVGGGWACTRHAAAERQRYACTLQKEGGAVGIAITWGAAAFLCIIRNVMQLLDDRGTHAPAAFHGAWLAAGRLL